jgi:hypothetical protein
MASGSQERAAQRSTLVVTNLTKMAGVVIGLHAGLEHTPDWRVIALAGLMVSGGQLSETLVLAAVDRIFGPPQKKKGR